MGTHLTTSTRHLYLGPAVEFLFRHFAFIEWSPERRVGFPDRIVFRSARTYSVGKPLGDLVNKHTFLVQFEVSGFLEVCGLLG